MELPTQYQQFIHQSKYARWLPEEGRRETWEETVNRYIDWIFKGLDIDHDTIERCHQAILRTEVMPSMRAMMTAGEAADRNNIAVYNCAYTPIESPTLLAEVLYVLMHGTGVGFSVERQEIACLPEVPCLTENGEVCPDDSKEGWFEAYKTLLDSLYSGSIPSLDTSHIRPAGAVLKTFGGRASGPGPLRDLWRFTIDTFLNAQGRKLTSIEVHDLCCMIGNVVVVGGVRRSALISLSNLSDDRMRHAKAGNWFDKHLHRRMANNSAVYDSEVSEDVFMEEWLNLAQSGSGERGIFNRDACQKIAERTGRQPEGVPERWGTNPCSEIILRPQQFCNLTEIVVREHDSHQDLLDKAEIATILGTAQATKTYFPNLSRSWKTTTERERLLGVSMTGVYDRPGFFYPSELSDIRDHCRLTNSLWAKRFNINESAAITCVKPSGTVSQLVNSASGLHPRYARHYIRRAQIANHDPLCQFMKDVGVPNEPYNADPKGTTVFSFPVTAPRSAAVTEDIDAITHLEDWRLFQSGWCEHKPSVTVSVPNGKWMEVGAWVWQHLDDMSGVAFMPWDGHIYQQAPYEPADEDTIAQMQDEFPDIDWDRLSEYEDEDRTIGSQELSCHGGACEL